MRVHLLLVVLLIGSDRVAGGEDDDGVEVVTEEDTEGEPANVEAYTANTHVGRTLPPAALRPLTATDHARLSKLFSVGHDAEFGHEVSVQSAAAYTFGAAVLNIEPLTKVSENITSAPFCFPLC